MKIEDRPLGEIRPYEKNPRRNDGAVDAVAASIREFGFKVPLVIDKDGVIVAGHTRYKAAQKLGLATVPCVVASDLTPAQVRAFRLADNKVAELAMWDNVLLFDELNELRDEDVFTGFIDSFNAAFEEAESEAGEEQGANRVIDEHQDANSIPTGVGEMFEVTFRSESKEKIERIQKLWTI